MHNLLIDLLGERISTNEAKQEQEEVIKNRRAKKFHFIKR